jgi:hypothetical protein
MRPLATQLLAILLLLSANGCAAVFTGTSDEVTFTSVPSGAEVVIDGKRYTTPCSAEVSKWVDEVTFRHEDHGDRVVKLDSSFQIGFLLMDFLFTPGFGSSGIIIDLITQAVWKHPAIVHCDFTAPPDADRKAKDARDDDNPTRRNPDLYDA